MSFLYPGIFGVIHETTLFYYSVLRHLNRHYRFQPNKTTRLSCHSCEILRDFALVSLKLKDVMLSRLGALAGLACMTDVYLTCCQILLL